MLATRGQLSIAASFFIAAAAAANAQGVGAGATHQLVNEIQALIEKGQRERLADPLFLEDLQAVLRRHDSPWRVTVFEDDFSGRGPEPARPWQVTRGEFRVDWRHGLRSLVSTSRAAADPAPRPEQREKVKSKDVAAALLGALMQQALSDNEQRADASQDRGASSQRMDAAVATPGEPAAVAAMVAIPNAFRLQVELSGRPVSGVAAPRLEIGPFQGANMHMGYRLIHQGNAAPAFTLLAVSGRGVSTVDTLDERIDLSDDQPHRLEWERDRSGRMRISLDDRLLMDVVDRRFRDSFDGLTVVNAAGDFALRSVRIDAAR